MPRQRHWRVEGIDVSRADVRRWMATVGARCPDAYYWGYVRDYAVIRKIAREKAAGTFESTVRYWAEQMRVAVPRKARSPNRLQQLRRRWPVAANEPAFASGGDAANEGDFSLPAA